jgi:dipeptidyl aminopeptidase/acylaminoacyl peptidase
MRKARKVQFTITMFFWTWCATAAWCGQANANGSETPSKRPVNIADSIRMTTIDNPNYSLGTWGRDDVAAFSPDGKLFVVIVEKGNLERNTVDYSLLLFQTSKALSATPPEVLATLSSSSTRPAIESLTWLDNRRVAFLGENPKQQHQLYTVDSDSRHLRQLTNQAGGVTNYAFPSNEGGFFFTEDKPSASLWGNENQLVVGHENLPELLSGVTSSAGDQDLFWIKKGANRPIRLRTNGKINHSALWPSPDGRYLVVQTMVDPSDISPDWSEYEDYTPRVAPQSKGELSFINRYELLDLNTGKSQPLIDAPLGSEYSNVAWSSDSHSIIVSGTYLPLKVSDPAERKLRQTHVFVVEVEVPDRVAVPITHQDANIRRWNSQTNKLLVQLSNRSSLSNFVEGKLVAFRRTATGWKEEDGSAVDEKKQNGIEMAVEEDMNTPPRLLAKNLKTQEQMLLLDPNPQFSELQFGHVEEIKCKAADGHEVTAGLYRPPKYVGGKRYPLVIQTHGWTSDRFWIDGPYTTAFAAQPLAAKGFVVVQLDENAAARVTPNEGKVAMEEYEAIINYLNGIGLIDANRIGIVAFSSTGFGVGYAIAHSKFRFGAAVLADTTDAGYFSYLSLFNQSVDRLEMINGGPPFGGGLTSWLREAPEFSLDKVNTAIRFEPNGDKPYGAFGALEFWEWFVGFRRLGKPVEMIIMPDAGHEVTRPQDRMTSQGGAVDWFAFWLNSEEDPDPAKAEQYKRWRELRKLQEQREKK